MLWLKTWCTVARRYRAALREARRCRRMVAGLEKARAKSERSAERERELRRVAELERDDAQGENELLKMRVEQLIVWQRANTAQLEAEAAIEAKRKAQALDDGVPRLRDEQIY